MNSGVCDEVSVPEHEVGGHGVLDQDIWSSFSCWPVSRSVCSRETTNGDTWTRKKRFVMGMGSQNDGGCWEGPQHAPRTLQNQEGRCSKARGPGAATPKGGRTIDVSARERGKERALPPLFSSSSASMDGGIPTHRPRLLSRQTQMPMALFRKHPRSHTQHLGVSDRSINSLPPARMLGRLTASGKRQGPRGLHPSFSVSILAGRNTREASTTRLDRCSPPE